MSDTVARLSEAISHAMLHLERYLLSEDSPPERLHAVAAMLGAQGSDLFSRSEAEGHSPALALVERIGSELIEAGPATIGALLTFLSARLFLVADQIADQQSNRRIY